MRNNRRSNQIGKHRTDIALALCYAGWFLFALSMFLPAFGDHTSGNHPLGWECANPAPGWECAKFAFMTFEYGAHNWIMAIVPTSVPSLAVANVLMLLSPWLLRRWFRSRKRAWLLPTLLMVATLDVETWQWFGREGCGIGYYVWELSFLLVSAGSILLLKSPRKTQPSGVFAYQPKTPEEMAALRESHAFHGSKIG